MGFLEGILYTLWRGIAIGIIISAPMGPVGILCVQRTLEKGRKTGFFTGVGATISDLFYCLLTGFGLSFIEEFLERNQNIIQLIGSVVLVAFAVYLFKSNPSRKLKKPGEKVFSAKKNILNGFLFTFSNPLIIFLIIGLFARFNFMVAGLKFYHYFIGFAAIAAGALIWWYIVSFFIDKVRSHFNLRSMWLINKIIGGVILIFAIVGMVTSSIALANAGSRAPRYLNSSRGFGPLKKAEHGPLLVGDSTGRSDSIAIGDICSSRFILSFRARNLHNSSGKKYKAYSPQHGNHRIANPSWGISLLSTSGQETAITFSTIDHRTDETYSPPCIEVCAITPAKGKTTEYITEGMDLFTGPNTFRIDFNNGKLSMRAGNRALASILSVPTIEEAVTEVRFLTSPGCLLELDYLELEFPDSRLDERSVYGNPDILKTHILRSKDPLEGIWMVYDRMLEEDRLRLGGNYRLAAIADPDGDNPGGYDLIYLDGAVVDSDKWTPGMIKARLKPSGFNNIWNVEWTDTSGKLIEEEVKAEYSGPFIIFDFPYRDGSSLRLRKTNDHIKQR